MTFYHRSPLAPEVPVYDYWHNLHTKPHTTSPQYYSKPVSHQGSYARMFTQDAIEPGNEYRQRSTTVSLHPKPHLQNQFVTDMVDLWGRRLQQNTNQSQSMFSSMDDAYFENPWDIYQKEKPYMDFHCLQDRFAHKQDVAGRWFR